MKSKILFLIAVFIPTAARADKIGEMGHNVFFDQIVRFFTFSDPSLLVSIAGCLLMGICLSLLGSFMVLRKMSLLGDTLGHAVLPGICIAFLITGTKSFLPTLLGAAVSGLSGVLLIGLIVRQSRIKTDAAMGMILSSFFGLGIVLLTIIQKSGSGNQSGLDKFLFGQAAALSGTDVWALFLITLFIGMVIFLFLKELTAVSFDENFSAAIGIPVGFVQMLLMVLTTVAVVASIQAVGVVLVSAMLIIPPATAYLLVKRVRELLLLGVLFGTASGFLGAFFSFLGPSLPTGPFMVVAAAIFFVLAFVFAPEHGWLIQTVHIGRRRRRTQRENILKSIYHLFEKENFQATNASFQSLAAFRNETLPEVLKHVRVLVRKKWIIREGEWIRFTEEGKKQATELVRKHRLWELFLVRETHLPADHVHADAEELEHVLSAEVMKELEEMLDHAKIDPHGKPIP